jgi:hypothetical protein
LSAVQITESDWHIKLNCFDQKIFDTVLNDLRELAVVQRAVIDWNVLGCVWFLGRLDSPLFLQMATDLYLTVFSWPIRAPATAAAFSKFRRGLEMLRLEDLHLMIKHQSCGTIFKKVPSAGKKDCWPLLIQEMTSLPDDPMCQAKLTALVNVQAVRFDMKTAARRLPFIKAGLIKQTFSNIEMTLDFVLNGFAAKKRARQSLGDSERTRQYGMHLVNDKLFCGRIDPFNDRICAVPIVFASDIQKSRDLVVQFLMVLWKGCGAEFREWLVGKTKE